MNFEGVKIDGLEDISLPKCCRVKQDIPDPRIDDVAAETRVKLENSGLSNKISPGQKVCIAAGSRGIHKLSTVIKSVVSYVKGLGANPVIVPAMGSHGGAEPDGQREVLEGYGIEESIVGAPIEASMEVRQVGETSSGVPVYCDSVVLESDAAIIVNRVKVHTSFSGEHESGILKMMAIGLGNHRGATTLHAEGFGAFSELIPSAGKILLQEAPIALGVGLLENGLDHLCEIGAWDPEEIVPKEKAMLERQKELMPEIPFDEVDLLIVEEIGKDISGSGMDTNVVGKVKPVRANIEWILLLDLTDETHGNACGVGLADLTTKRVFDKFDPASTYTNLITSKALARGRLPVILSNDLVALKTGIKLSRKNPDNVKIVRLKNTLELGEFEVSEGLLPEVRDQSLLSIVEEPRTLVFNEAGELKRL